MRRARLSFPNSYHHVMNKGLNGEVVFLTTELKKKFLELINKNKRKYGIKIIAYCIMKNHFHLVLKDEKGKLSQFMKKVEGDFGCFYRQNTGGKGYVFITRFKSTLIQEDVHLKTSLIYVLLNPVRSNYTKFVDDYQWSSYNEYFKNSTERVTDMDAADTVFSDKLDLNEYIKNFKISKISVNHTRFGDMLSEDAYIKIAENRSDRRKNKKDEPFRRVNERRKNDCGSVIAQFEKKYGIQIKRLNGKTENVRFLRKVFLLMLRERTPLTYLQIQRLTPFKNLKLSSLANIYFRSKNEINEKHRPPDKY